MPKLGIVVPHYNQNDTLYKSVRSLFTHKVNKEIVVVDDGSRKSVLPSRWEPFPIPVIRFNYNQGVQIARNTGFQYISRFKCEYILFSDSDVIWYPGALDKMVSALDADPSASFAYCDFTWGHVSMVSGDWSLLKLRRENYISTMSVVRSSALRSLGMFPWNESVSRLQDWALWLSLSEMGGRGVYVQEVLFQTDMAKNGISSRGNHRAAVEAVRSQTDQVSSCLEDIDMGSAQKLTTPPIGGDAEAVIGDFSAGLGKYFVHGTDVPADGVEGYAPGCLFIDVDGGQGATLYVNEGTLASANFDLITTA